MKIALFAGRTHEEVEQKIQAWRACNPGITEVDYLLSEDGAPAGRFAPKTHKIGQCISVTITYKELG